MQVETPADVDITLLCGEVTLLIRRSILVEASPVFCAMLEGGFEEGLANRIDLGDDDPDAWKLCVDILLRGCRRIVASRREYPRRGWTDSAEWTARQIASVAFIIDKYQMDLIYDLMDADRARMRGLIPSSTYYCALHQKEPRLRYHCDQCGGKDRIVEVVAWDDDRIFMCTGCGRQPRLPHHCDKCTHSNNSRIIELVNKYGNY
jgi:hypothetical protein